jgi:putative ATP-dependent endonuclease of OLD family
MQFTSIKFKGYRCFQDDWAGFDAVKPITVIIGRNNTGKSHLLHLVKNSCEERIIPLVNGEKYQVGGILDEMTLRSIFPDQFEGRFYMNLWRTFGCDKIGNHISATITRSSNEIRYEPDYLFFFKDVSNQYVQLISEPKKEILTLFKNGSHAFSCLHFRHLLADRDIKTELPTNDLMLSPEGVGATNIVRRFIHSTHEDYPRDHIQVELLHALNYIFAKDGHFTEIQCKVHDAPQEGQSHLLNHWEIFVRSRKIVDVFDK